MTHLKIYTQADFNAFPIVDGYRICPTGDYSQVRHFGHCNKFDHGNKFGDGHTFGNGNKFGDGHTFGDWTTFGHGNTFGDWTTFGDQNKFGDGNTFEGVPNAGLLCLSNFFGSGRQIQIISNGEKTKIRAGCFLGSIDDFTRKARYEAKLHYVDFMPAVVAAFVAEIKRRQEIKPEGKGLQK